PVAKQQLGTPEVQVADSRGAEIVTAQVPPPVVSTPLPPPTTPPTPTEPPPPPTPQEPPVPDPPVAAWGRWAVLFENDTVVKAQDVLQGRNLVSRNKYYVLAANPAMTSMALPGEGVGRFALTAHDGVITDNTTGRSVVSTASDGSLQIDFGSRRF